MLHHTFLIILFFTDKALASYSSVVNGEISLK